jgi:hypothetical protein
MSRGELAALRDVIDVLLKLPDRLRDQVAQWLCAGGRKAERRRSSPAAERVDGQRFQFGTISVAPIARFACSQGARQVAVSEGRAEAP